MVADGVADAYFFPSSGTKRWDACAPHALLNALGGKVTDANGKDISYAAHVS